MTFKQAGRDQTGIVFLARDLTRSRDVGLKIILAEELTTGDRRKVRQQIAIAEKLANQRSVQICRTGQYQGLPYYTMVLLKLGKLAKPPGRGFEAGGPSVLDFGILHACNSDGKTAALRQVMNGARLGSRLSVSSVLD